MTLGLTHEGANTWCWRRDRISQCRQESWCCTAESAQFRLWEICHCLASQVLLCFESALHAASGAQAKQNTLLIFSFKSSFLCCLGPQGAHCPSEGQCVCQLHGCHFASSVIHTGEDCFNCGMCDAEESLCFHT